MPLVRRDTPEGPVWIRPPFRPEGYTASSEAILALRDGPFGNYVQVDRQIRDGRSWLVLLEASREFGVLVEAVRSGFGEVVAVPPLQAYQLACARDSLRSRPVIREP